MNCREFRARTHQFLDGEVSPREWSLLDGHLASCLDCRREYEEFSWIKQACTLERLSQPMGEELWSRIRGRIDRKSTFSLLVLWEDLRVYWRDLDRRIVWSALTATPLTVLLFLAVFMQFVVPPHPEQRVYPMMVTLSPMAEPAIEQVSVHYRGTEIEDLMSAVWKIPYEDSLSLVASITPQGHAEIGDVLDYPRSQDLLRAVDLTLRGGKLEAATRAVLDTSFLIYSFQKVDVYEDQRGL